jgi:hypothetical protein
MEGETEEARVLDGEREEKDIRIAVQDIWKINLSVGFWTDPRLLVYEALRY